MAAKDETAITRSIIAQIKGYYKGDAWHVHGSALQRGGEPDIDGAVKLFPDYVQQGAWTHLKLEVKTPVGEPDKRQLYRMQQYWRMGYLVGVVVDEFELHTLIQQYKKWMEQQPTHVRFGESHGLKLPYAEELYFGVHNR